MEALEAIFTRRSVRKFLPKTVNAETVEKILQAAMSAPSARNGQPWHFLVIDQREILDTLAEANPYAAMCREAALAIIPCVDLGALVTQEFWPLDLAAATENILLAVRALGLGAVWCGVYPNPEHTSSISNLLNLPEKVVPFAIIPIGYTDLPQETAERFQKKRVHFNKW
jgi:nitroreductase